MRAYGWLAGAILILALAGSVPAQISSVVKTKPNPTAQAPTFSTFLNQTMAKPNFTPAMSAKPTMPIAPNPAGAFPRLQFENLMLMRNVFRPNVTVAMPKSQVPPPPKSAPPILP